VTRNLLDLIDTPIDAAPTTNQVVDAVRPFYARASFPLPPCKTLQLRRLARRVLCSSQTKEPAAMRAIVVTHSDYSEFPDLIAGMHRLRYRVFRDRLNWDVSVSGDMEIDAYDALKPTYIIAVDDSTSVVGCARLLPTTGPTMLANTFPALLGSNPTPRSDKIFESSRFCVDTSAADRVTAVGLRDVTFSLLAGILEWGLSHNQEAVVTVTDVRFERILSRAGWPLERFAPPMQIDSTKALAGRLAISDCALSNVRETGQLKKPILVSHSMRVIAA
jgi:N-acyl-L-homoserine lactone synthetase